MIGRSGAAFSAPDSFARSSLSLPAATPCDGGTDRRCRDVWSRTLHGQRLQIEIASGLVWRGASAVNGQAVSASAEDALRDSRCSTAPLCQSDARSDQEAKTMCKVLNKHQAGIPAGAIYIGRGSRWGNPFRIGQDGDRATVIVKYERWLVDQHHLLRTLD